MEFILGLLIATAVGLTGVGGGSLTAPLLILALGLPAPEAVGTALLFVTVTKLVATPVYFFRGQVVWSAALWMMAGGLPGVIAGSIILSRMRASTLEPYVLTIIGVTIVVLALVSLCRLIRAREGRIGGARAKCLPWIALPIGLEVGFSSAGAGALGTLALMECTTLSAGQVVATDLVFGLAISAVGGGLHFAAGNLNPHVLIGLCSGGVIGALAGAWLGTRVPSRPLRAGLTLFLVFLGGQLSWRGLQILAR